MLQQIRSTFHLRRLWRIGTVGLMGILLVCGMNVKNALAYGDQPTPQSISLSYSLISQAPSQQPLETVNIHLGNAADELRFEPEQLSFRAGQRYKLILDNPSTQKHYFTAKDFADVIWSQKVEAAGVEVKGAIHELELKPAASAEWVFVPQKPGIYELHCSIAGHAEAGMTGRITVFD